MVSARFVSVVGAACIPRAAGDDFTANWMGRVGGLLAKQSLLDLTLPGTHDTMTYDLSTAISNAGIDDYPTLAGLLSEFGSLGEIGEYMRKQATTQALSITQQLDAGIRFLDFRVMHTNGDWYSLHLVRSNRKALEYLQEVRTWLDAHPSEVIVMWLSKHGSQCNTGNDQYPGVSADEKQKFWQQIQDVFSGLLVDTSQSSLNSTPLSDLVSRGHRVAVFATDFQEFTGGTTLATDGCMVDNRLAMASVDGLDTKHDIDYFAGIKDILAKDKADGKFFLLSMANSPPGEQMTDALKIEYLPGETDLIPQCAATFNIPDMTGWCPETLLDVGQLTAYYRQQTLEAAYQAGHSFPNAIYIDAVGDDGVIRTGTKRLNAGDEPVCNIYKWSSCQTSQPECDDGWVANGYKVHFNCYDYDGNKHGFCGWAWQDHYKCCRQADAEHATDAYGYVDTLVAYNVRSACAGNGLSQDDCASTMAMLEERRARNPVKTWSDPLNGRLQGWPAVSDGQAYVV